nr:hypothetical protein [Aulosira sp. DedVER01a]
MRRRSPPQALRLLTLPVMMVVTAFTHTFLAHDNFTLAAIAKNKGYASAYP